MDSRIGLDFIVENPEYIGKLAAALDTNTIAVKKQVIELLSALCVHNAEGHERALDTLACYKKLKGERYRFSFLVKELESTNVVAYQTALVAFINCLIISTPRLFDRTRLRNEFIGCHLLPVLNHLRKCAEAEPELAVQLDVFDEQRESDDAQSVQGPNGVDLNSPLDVFYAILKQVADTPQEIPFLSILQHLLRIDAKDAISDIIWDTAERLIHRAVLVENRDDAVRLLRTPGLQSKVFCSCQQQQRTESSPPRKPSLTSPLSPPPAPPGPPPSHMSFGVNQVPPPPPPPNIPPPPPSVPFISVKDQSHRAASSPPTTDLDQALERLPQQETPVPKIKMKTINWNKIPNNKVVGKNNIWTQVAFSHQDSPMTDLDWTEMEGLFCQQILPSNSVHSSPKMSTRSFANESSGKRMRKDTNEITLLDGKRSLNINIFLKQFRSSNEEIIQLIKNGEHDDIGAEKLRGLLKILPEIDEMDMLTSFNGDFEKLGNAEKFLLRISNLTNYKLRIESMLLKEEFASNMNYLEPSINSMIMAAQDLMTNKPLKEVLYMVLVAGNFLNSGGYAGNAAGVKLTSLQKITDIRANKPNMNLIHYVALQAEKRNKSLLLFAENVGILEEAAKNTVEQLNNEINALDIRIKKIKKQIDLPTTEIEIKRQMVEFLQMAEREVANLQRAMVQLDRVRKQLADFFCEDANSFKLEECFRIFHGFYIKFRQAAAENARRRLQEEQANARRRQREELIASKRRQMGNLTVGGDAQSTEIYDIKSGLPIKKGKTLGQDSSFGSDEELSIAGSPSVTRRRLGSFTCQSGDTNLSVGKDEKSPDITPNGSLRRRRSRVLSEEDEGNLMEFLRTSSCDSRERKSWGSLDRSWARRARGGAPKKRPALLSADFSADRERPSSPSPLAETKSLLSTPEPEVKPREWRQKIESWLQANENDQITDETRRRRLANRRSLEIDSESERSSNLETLPEGKQVYTGGQSIYKRVYPDWTPSATIEKTDVVSAMETVEEVQPQVKDKSSWRKSNLNVSNSTEATKDDVTRYRHTLPRITHTSDETPFQAANDSNVRKEFISSLGERPALDKITLYIRAPADVATTNAPDNCRKTLGSGLRGFNSQQSSDTHATNKVDIDQDNIETPPTTRRIFTPTITPVDKREPLAPTPCSRLKFKRETKESQESEANATLGEGQFDRFSAARRTRRYKRNADAADGSAAAAAAASELVTEVIKPANLHVEKSEPIRLEKTVDKDTRLRVWQDKLKAHDLNAESKAFNARRLRNQTGINHMDLKKALKLNGPQTEKRYASKTVDMSSDDGKDKERKTREHDNDEGFEETQSLMSESPSQGASSGGNYETDAVESSTVVIHYKSKPLRTISTESKSTVDSTASSEKPSESSKKVPINATKSLIQKYSNQKAGERATRPAAQKSTIPRRAGSMRKPDAQTNLVKKTERSSSRNSIVSSKSSLNSATSTNTVKRIPLKPANAIGSAAQKMAPRTPAAKTFHVTANKSGMKRPALISNGNQKPPKPNVSTFMKPTAASATKTSLPSKVHTVPYRFKN